MEKTETLKTKLDNYLNDSDVMNVAYKAASPFLSSLSKDEIENCVVTAIWKASQKFNKRNKTKFTSYLWKGVRFECLTQRKLNQTRPMGTLSPNIVDPANPFASVDMIDCILSNCEDPDLVIDRFYKNKTIRELAEDRRVCGETIRIRLKKNLKKLEFAL